MAVNYLEKYPPPHSRTTSASYSHVSGLSYVCGGGWFQNNDTCSRAFFSNSFINLLLALLKATTAAIIP